MKFAKYLEEAQTPEWKKAYINYRALKKDISALKRAQEGLVQIEPTADPVASPSPATFHVALSPIDSPHPYVFFPGDRPLTTEPLETTPSTGRRTRDYVDVPQDDNYVASDDAAEIQTEARDHVPSIESSTHYGTARSHFTSQASSLMRRMTNRLPRMPRRGTGFSLHDAIHRLHTPEPFAAVPSYAVLLTLLSPAELAFFDMLDAERAKIETFYLAREKELQDRTTQLRGQLHELIDHRRLIEALARSSCTTAALPQSIRLRISALKPSLLPAAGQSASTLIEQRDEADPEKGLPRTFGHKREWSSASSTHRRNMLDPDDFHNAKRSLKKAVTEHYRALELLQNYRILNITGFRKALKKFQKVTKIPCSDLYMREKVDNSAFASDSNIKQMMTEMESLYAACFAEGDKKRATARLRAATEQKTHHFSTFRTGLTIGVSLPPLALGIYQATQDSVRDNFPAWDALILIYGIFFLPILLAILIGHNILVWSHTRINYTFIFGFDARTRLDHREYFEMPARLLAALAWAFWLTTSGYGAPEIWPLVWLGLVLVVLANPFPFDSRPSRFWLLRTIGRLFLSGTKRVDFADFWMGDQICSLVFSLSNVYVVPCIYATDFDEDWREHCMAESSEWPVLFAIGTIPFFVRAIQSTKRYFDTGKVIQLANAGKYGLGIITYLIYFRWRHEGEWSGPYYIAYIVLATLYSIIACGWDFVMDWSILNPKASTFMLRDELLYGRVYYYYVAMLFNFIGRFAWIFYVIETGPDFLLRSFVVGVIEVTRRWVWNFCRLENEHIGNVDQYRATREIPLPYWLEEDIDSEEARRA